MPKYELKQMNVNIHHYESWYMETNMVKLKGSSQYQAQDIVDMKGTLSAPNIYRNTYLFDW